MRRYGDREIALFLFSPRSLRHPLPWVPGVFALKLPSLVTRRSCKLPDAMRADVLGLFPVIHAA